MAKRKPLAFDNKQLSDDLKESAGKGVDALFAPTPTATTKIKSIKEPENSSPPSDANDSPKKKEKKPKTPTENLSKQEAKTESRELDTYIPRYLDRNLDRYLEYLRPFLNASGIQVNFNYPQELIDKFDDLVFELNRLARQKKSKRKVTKTSLLVAALAYLIWDYEVNKKESILHRIIEKENE